MSKAKYAVCTLRRSDGALIPEHWYIGSREEAVETRTMMESHCPESLWLITTYLAPHHQMGGNEVFDVINYALGAL